MVESLPASSTKHTLSQTIRHNLIINNIAIDILSPGVPDQDIAVAKLLGMNVKTNMAEELRVKLMLITHQCICINLLANHEYN